MRMVAHGGAADDPDPDEVEEWVRRTSPPENEIPASAGLTALVVRSDDVAVAITGVEVYSTGFRFTLAVRVPRPRPEVGRGGLFSLVDGHMHGGGVAAESHLLLGLEYPDGRRASTLEDARATGPRSSSLDELVLVSEGGSGDDTRVDQRYWVAPLPPHGPVAFIVSWPAFGVTESRTELDGGAIRGAASRSVTLWPPQRGAPPREPTPPPRPTSGWFAQRPS